MPSFGTLYGGFVFDQDEIVDWGKRLGAPIGEELEAWKRTTPLQLRVNSFGSAENAIRRILQPYGVDLYPVSDSDDYVNGDWMIATRKGTYSRRMYKRNPEAVPVFREGLREEKARKLLQDQGFSREQLRFEIRYD